uniref:Uncharacterized protein n=1 Tax=OCS116 cluster bacterium TaxID=2030921 RepID=A0A2A4YRS8_9PROT
MDDIYKVVFGVIAGLIGVVSFFMKINSGNSSKFKDVHSRIDNIKEKYVRRDDFAMHIERIEKTIENQANDQKVFMAEIRAFFERKIK